MSKLGVRIGTAAFAVGISLAAPHSAGVAVADSQDSESSPAVAGSDTRGQNDQARSTARQSSADSTRGRVVRTTGRVPSNRPATDSNDAHFQPLPAASATRTAPPPRVTAPRLRTVVVTPTVIPPASAVAAHPRPPASTAVPTASASGNAGCAACWGRQAPTIGTSVNTVINHAFNSTFDWLSTLPGGPVTNLLEGSLVLVRRSLFLSPEGVTATQTGTSLTIAVNTGSVAYFRQDGTSLQVSGDPRFWGATTFDATGIHAVAVSNSPGSAGCAGLVVESGTVAATLSTSQIDAIRFGTDAAFTKTVTSTVTGGPLTLRDAVRGLTGVTLNAPVVLANDVEVDAGTGNAAFTGTVDAAKAGKQSLTVTALGTTTFGQAVGSAAALGSLLTRGIAPLDIPQTNDTKTIPLHILSDFSTTAQPQVKYGIDVAIGNNPSQLYEFDTGGVSLFAGYNPSFWKNVPLTTIPASESYSSGIYYNGVVADTPITLGSGTHTVSTGRPIQIAAILAGGNSNNGATFDFTNPDAPPVEDNFFGDFGASFDTVPVPGQSTPMANPLFQLPGNLSSGFLVQLGPIGIDPQLSVGVTDALRAQFTYAIPVAPNPDGGTYPVSGYDVLSWFGFSAAYSANGKDGEMPIGDTPTLPSLIDSGAPIMGIRIKDGGGYPYSTTGKVPGQLESGTTFTGVFPTTAGRPALKWTFTAGDNGSVDQVDYEAGQSSGPQTVNTGLNLYNQYDVMFDVAQKVIWLRPTGGQSTVSLQTVTTTGAQTYQQNADLAGTYNTGGSAFSVAGVTTLLGNTVVNTGTGDVRFSGTVDAIGDDQSLVVNSSGTTTFVRPVGSQQALTTLTTDAPGSTSTSMVRTSGDQTYNDPVSLGGEYTVGNGTFNAAGATTLTAPVAVTGGEITFASTIDSAPNRGYSLTLTPGKGKSATLGGDLGLTNPLGGLAITAKEDASAAVTATGYVALAGDLGYSTVDGLTIGPNVDATFSGGGLIRNFTGDGVLIGTPPAPILPLPAVVEPVITGFTISGNGGNGIDAMSTYGGTFTSNAILNNGGAGVVIDGGVGNRLLSNSIWGNGGETGVGIALVNGGNNSQPAPTVTSAVLNPGGTSLTVQFTLDPLPSGAYTAQVFYTPTGPAQGQQLLQTLAGQTQGAVTTTIPVSSAVVANGFITVTATTDTGDTSQFSAGAVIPAGS